MGISRSSLAHLHLPSLPPQDMVAVGEARIAAKKSTTTAVARFERYLVFCQSHGYSTVPQASYTAVAGFLAEFMTRNNGHTATLEGVLSNLRTQHDERGMAFLPPAAARKLKLLMADWKRHDTTVVNRKLPLRFLLVLQIVARMNLSDVAQLQRATQMVLAVQALLRTKEVTGGLRASDFVFRHAERIVAIHLAPTKTCTSGAGVWIEVADTTHPISAYKLLLRLFASRSLATRPTDFMVFF